MLNTNVIVALKDMLEEVYDNEGRISITFQLSENISISLTAELMELNTYDDIEATIGTDGRTLYELYLAFDEADAVEYDEHERAWWIEKGEGVVTLAPTTP